jgi:hypothetical protein
MTDTTMNTGAASLSDEQIEQLHLIERCDPSLLIHHIEEDTAYDGPLVARVFELAKERARSLLATPTPQADAAPSELASMTRMFHAACADLGAINEALGLDPDDGGAGPILDAIAELRAAIAAGGAQEPIYQQQYCGEGVWRDMQKDKWDEKQAGILASDQRFRIVYAAPLPRVAATALTIQAVRTLLIRHAESYSEWDDGSIERIDFGQYGFGKFARALLAASNGEQA